MRTRIILLLILIIVVSATAQTVREKIDSERGGSFLDPKTLDKARSFIRRDSTYYLGYMFEGAFLFFRANDELGFRKAARPLQKALDKIEKDYDRRLRTRTNNFNVYNENYRFHFDYGLITYFLNRCYQNVENQEKAMDVLRHIRERDFQMEVNMDSYNTMAWLYHRNRMYTSKNFSFLKNSVQENVAAANRCLDSAIRKLRKDMPLNNGLFDPSYLNRQYLSTFHYKAMIHDYLLNIDSTNYYYDILIQNGAYSANNYANFKMAMAEFEDADLYFKEASERDGGAEKNTKEFYYMRGTLNTYRGHPEESDTLLRNVLQRQGSTPGYGWHTIGLARAQHFEGLTAESQERTNKAARFQELHIGTTWGQEQYNLAVASLNYINQLQFKKEYMFEHDEWYFWLNPVNWYRWVKYTIQVRHHKMVLASLVAENPEREQVIYSIFSPENLISFDEVWSVIEGFGNEYFIDIYKRRLETDSRPRVKKFYYYFIGKLYLAEDDEDEAIRYFNLALQDEEIDDQYHVLLKARVIEGLALASSGEDRTRYIRQVYDLYPQLLPFSDLTMDFRLITEESENTEDLLDELRDSRINFTSDENAPTVSLSVTPLDKAININYTVEYDGDIFQTGTLRVENEEREGAGKLLAYRLFGIQKTKIGETIPPAPKAEPVKKEKAEEKPDITVTP
jgi:tetratricopeptide (TPR) repeat protein